MKCKPFRLSQLSLLLSPVVVKIRSTKLWGGRRGRMRSWTPDDTATIRLLLSPRGPRWCSSSGSSARARGCMYVYSMR